MKASVISFVLVIMLVIASSEEITDFDPEIKQYDLNKDGSIDSKEFRRIAQTIFTDLLSEFDTDHDRKYNYKEFDKAFDKFLLANPKIRQNTTKQTTTGDEITDFDPEIKPYDLNKDGSIDSKEFREIAQNIFTDLLSEFDTDHDRKYNYKEFDKAFDKFLLANPEIGKNENTDFDPEIKSYDLNNDSSIDLEEIKEIAQTIFTDLLREFDTDHDRKYNYKEFDKAFDKFLLGNSEIINIGLRTTQQSMTYDEKTVFDPVIKPYDQNKDGSIDLEEFKEIVQTIFTDLLSEFDTDHDGKYNYKEFDKAFDKFLLGNSEK